MPQQTNPQIDTKIEGAYTGGTDRVEWVDELKIICKDLNDSKINNDQIDVADGVAGLDAAGKLPLTTLDDAAGINGQVIKKVGGVWAPADEVDISGKQDTLVSGTNIKTINGASVLGAGDLVVTAASDAIWYDVADYLPEGVTLATSSKAQRTAAWVAAIADAQTDKAGLKFAGTWDVATDTIEVTDTLAIVGNGMNSVLSTSDVAGTVLKVNAFVPRDYYEVVFADTKPFIGRDFKIIQTAVPTSTSVALYATCTASVAFLHSFEGITFDGFYDAVRFHNIANANITKCYFRNNRRYGFANTNNESQDFGKLIMTGNVFAMSASLQGLVAGCSHVRIEGGAGFNISNNDFYGYTDHSISVDLDNSSEFFAALHSTEYIFQHNRFGFNADYAIIMDNAWGKGGANTAYNGNRISDVQICDNQVIGCGFLKTIGGNLGSFNNIQISNNKSTYALMVPISLRGTAMTDLCLLGNVITANVLGSAFGGATKPLEVTGSAVLGTVNATANQYIGFPNAPDILNGDSAFTISGSDIYRTAGKLGIGTPAAPADVLVVRQDQVTSSLATTSKIMVVNGQAGNAIAAMVFGDGSYTTLGGFQYNYSSGNMFGLTFTDIPFYLGTNSAIRMTIGAGAYAGNIGIGVTTPTARLNLAAGTATASTAPCKLTTGVVLTTPEAGALEYTTPKLYFTNGTSIRQEIPLIQQTRVSTQFDITSDTTLANVTGLTANVAAAGVYRFEALLYCASVNTGGVKAAIGGTATATSIIYEGMTTDAGVTTQSRGTAMAAAVGAVTAVTAAVIKITGTIVVNAAGTLTIQFAQNASDVTASSVLVGSVFVVTQTN